MGDRIDEVIESLHDQAVTATGLTDFGDGHYLEGIRMFVEDLLTTPGLDDGRLNGVARALAGGILADRLRTQEAWRAHPDALAMPLERPIVITGIPRSGTTALHQLLAMDPRFQVVEKWLINDPRPRPPRERWTEFPRYEQAIAALELVPESLRRSHFVHPDDADECLLPMAQSFVSNWFGSMATLPSYDKWLLAQDMGPSLRRYADFLRLVGSTSPERAWLLKNPSHVLCLDELFAVYPEACVIQTHRDPQAAIASVVSTIGAGGELIGYQRPPAEIARREIALWSEGMRRSTAARNGRKGSFCDVDYRDFSSDPMNIVRRIYHSFAIELPEPVERSMSQWVIDHPRGRHGEHTYDARALGVDHEAIDEAFGPYIEEYNLR